MALRKETLKRLEQVYSLLLDEQEDQELNERHDKAEQCRFAMIKLGKVIVNITNECVEGISLKVKGYTYQ